MNFRVERFWPRSVPVTCRYGRRSSRCSSKAHRLTASSTNPRSRSHHSTALTGGFGGDLDPNLSRRGDLMVFSSTRSGQRNLWIALGDGADARPLTSGPSFDEHPQFAPETAGRLHSNRGGDRGLWIVATDGGVPRRLLNAPILPYFSWPPDGPEIVYSTPVSELPGLSVVTVADGRTRRLLTRVGATSPAWSPSADVIAYLEVTPNTPGQHVGVPFDVMARLRPGRTGRCRWMPAACPTITERPSAVHAVRQVFRFPDDAFARPETMSETRSRTAKSVRCSRATDCPAPVVNLTNAPAVWTKLSLRHKG
jgi:hypothetical protein